MPPLQSTKDTSYIKCSLYSTVFINKRPWLTCLVSPFLKAETEAKMCLSSLVLFIWQTKHQGKLCESWIGKVAILSPSLWAWFLITQMNVCQCKVRSLWEEVSKCHLECNDFCIHYCSQVTHQPLQQTAQHLQVYEVSVWANWKTCRAFNILSWFIQSGIFWASLRDICSTARNVCLRGHWNDCE